jgi:hypothetical protein
MHFREIKDTFIFKMRGRRKKKRERKRFFVKISKLPVFSAGNFGKFKNA